jgi:HPt (histidine-containing phosphotransfer) domain-containing protein
MINQMTPEEPLKCDLDNFLTAMGARPEFTSASFQQLIEDTSEDVAIRMLARFHQTLGESISFIRDGLAKHHCETIWRASHKVAGTAELLGLRELGKASKSLTQSLRALTEIEAHTDEIRNYLKSCEDIHNAILQSCPNLSYYL